jgi:three-Cys-motif partner protein
VATDVFFDEQTERSAKKTSIVAKYFQPWSQLVSKPAQDRSQPLQYLDLCAGPGHYDDGSPSTPILILSRAIADPKLRDILVTHFNDKDKQHSQKLAAAVRALPGVEDLRHTPRVENYRVDDQLTQALQQEMSGKKLVATLSFLDPFGYGALSLQLIHLLTRDWGCDCVFFFNYNRIRAAINNRTVAARMDALFGRERAHALRQRIIGLGPREAEQVILHALAEAVEEGGRMTCRYTFKNDAGTRTWHHIVLVTKAPRGIQIMKQIMAKEGAWTSDGVPTFEHNPARERQQLQPAQLGLFPEPPSIRPLDQLRQGLLTCFAGRTLSVRQVCDEYDRVDSRFITPHYKDALLSLEATGAVSMDPPADRRRTRLGKPTLADGVRIRFPRATDRE